MKKVFYARKESDLSDISTAFLASFEGAKIFAFFAEMGAGKTTFIRYLAKAMGIADEVSSPTYGFVNEYESPTYGQVNHFDLYRIESEEEAYDIGLEEYLDSDQFVFIEWAENIDNRLPESCVRIKITQDKDGGRCIEAKL